MHLQQYNLVARNWITPKWILNQMTAMNKKIISIGHRQWLVFHYSLQINSFPPWQNDCHFVDDIIECIFTNEKFRILIQISLKFVPKGPINRKSALVQVMAWQWAGDKPLHDQCWPSSPMHVCSIRGDQLTHCGLVTPYGDRDLGQHWLR